MLKLSEIVRMTIETGEPLTISGMTVTPRSRALVVRLPFGGLVWNRPIGVTVRRGEYVDELPIRDRTRRIQIVCALALFVVFLMTRRTFKKEIPR